MYDFAENIPQTGRVEWMGIATSRRGPIVSVEQVTVRVGTGIDGEHHAQGGNSDRQVTLIQYEHLPVIAALVGRDRVPPELLRRNLAVSGINLIALKNRRFRIGEVLLEGTGACAPCSLMEENLGPGGYNAMRGHGGITARVLQAGRLSVGSGVSLFPGE